MDGLQTENKMKKNKKNNSLSIRLLVLGHKATERSPGSFPRVGEDDI